ncbi:MAG: cell division protein FtsA [Candidatus Kerfeldbacteria bacterium]|nr:cell division protein FtsA [Candidatus Kerfeldbacteria bacterium]
MARQEIITGIDVGSSMIRVAVGTRQAESDKLHILGVGEHSSEGISKGVINSIEDAVSGISGALEAAERMTGIPIEHAFVGITGAHVLSQDSTGVVAVSKADGEIRDDDIERVLQAAQSVNLPQNYELLHVIPRHFSVDDQKNIKDPVGMSGIRLEVDAQIIMGQTAQIKNLTTSIYRTSVDIDDLVLGILACAESILTKRQKELGVALVNMGAATTSMIVFEEGDVVHTKVLPVGSGHVTNDVAIGLRTSIDVAEKIKLEYGTCLPGDVNPRDEIYLDQIEPSESGAISKKHIAEIIAARIEEIFKMVDHELQLIGRSGLLPAGVVLTGGGAKLPGMVPLAKDTFKLPAQLGYPKELVTAIERINDPAFATAVGLVLWGAELPSGGGHGSSLKSFSTVNQVTQRMKGWIKNFLP